MWRFDLMWRNWTVGVEWGTSFVMVSIGPLVWSRFSTPLPFMDDEG